MRIKSGYQIDNSSGQYTIFYKGKSTGVRLDSIVSLETTPFMWKMLKEKDMSKTEMLDALISEFDISTVLALGNIDIFVRILKENGIIEE